MAIDTAEKRRSASGVGFFPLGPGVTPTVGKDQEWRQQSVWSYSGILAGAPLSVQYAPNTDRSIRIDVYTPTGEKVGPGPITTVFAGGYDMGVGVVGTFQLELPAEDPRTSLIGHGYELRIHRGDVGLVYRGLVDKLDTVVEADERKVLKVSGASIARRLVWANTGVGLTFASQTCAESVDTLLALATGFTAGEIDSPSTVLEASRMDGVSVWAALARVAETFGLLLREDNINAQVDVGLFGASARGLRFQSAEQMTPELGASENVFAISGIQEIADSGDVWNEVIPQGMTQGISGNVPNLTLEDSTRSTPYAITPFTGADGISQYKIGDSASQAAYGTRTKVLNVKDVAPLGLTDSELIAAANTLYDRAVTWLQRHKDPKTTYAVRVVGMKHLVNGLPVFQVGDKVRVIYRGAVVDSIEIIDGLADQRALLHAFLPDVQAAIDALNQAFTQIQVSLVPLNGGPFETVYALAVGDLMVPRMIDLEAA